MKRALLVLAIVCSACGSKQDLVELSVGGIEVSIAEALDDASIAAGVDLPALVRTELGRIEAALGVLDTAVVFVAGSQVIPQAGMVGFTDPSRATVTMTVDPETRLGLAEALKMWTGPMLAHELHHAKRIIDGPGYGSTLRAALVSEGSADSFALDVYPDVHAPWNNALSAEQEADAWRTAEPVLDETEGRDEHARWFFGAGDLPNWTGYTIGFKIAQRYLESHPGESAAELALKGAAAITDGSGYGG